MDYSLLVSLHFRDISHDNDDEIGEARPMATALHTSRGLIFSSLFVFVDLCTPRMAAFAS